MLDPEITVKNSVTIPTVYSTGSTVDADSAAAQKVLNVAATGAFTAGDRVIINRGGAREEQAVIDSVQAGVSITLLTNLVYTHTQVQADVVEVCMASLSTVLVKKHYKYMALFLPANWTTAAITFVGCDTVDGTFNQLVVASDIGEVTIASVAASKVIVLDGKVIEAIIAVPYIKLRSGTLVAPVDQGATVKIISYVLKR